MESKLHFSVSSTAHFYITLLCFLKTFSYTSCSVGNNNYIRHKITVPLPIFHQSVTSQPAVNADFFNVPQGDLYIEGPKMPKLWNSRPWSLRIPWCTSKTFFSRKSSPVKMIWIVFSLFTTSQKMKDINTEKWRKATESQMWTISTECHSQILH